MQRQPELWELVWLGKHSRIYLNAGKIIGHLGVSKSVFEEAAKLLLDYDKYRYENAVRDLTVYSKGEQDGRYELRPTAKKILRIIIGPSLDAPDYASWWRGRLISVQRMKEAGQPVEWAERPPVPLVEPCEESRQAAEPEANSEETTSSAMAGRTKESYARAASVLSKRGLMCMLRDARQQLAQHGKRSFCGKEAKKEIQKRGLTVPIEGKETVEWDQKEPGEAKAPPVPLEPMAPEEEKAAKKPAARKRKKLA
jgi:hypothetical protein